MTDASPPAQSNEDGLTQIAKTEDARFLTFAREYLGLLATVTAIPLLSSVFEVIPEPIADGRLSVLSSFMCLIVFASCFLLRGNLKRWADADDRKQYIPWLLVLLSVVLSIVLTVCYFTTPEATGTMTSGESRTLRRILTYLPIYPCLIFGLGIFLVTAFTQQQGYTIQSYIDAEPELKRRADQILELLKNYVAFHDLCKQNPIFGTVGNEFIKPEQQKLAFLREGRLEAGRHDAILANGLLQKSPMIGFHAVSDRDLEFWANLEGDFMAREYFRLNQHMLERKHTIVTRVFILSDADLKRTDVIVPILQQHESTGIGWAIVIFEELNPTISNHQNKPLDFALLIGQDTQGEAKQDEAEPCEAEQHENNQSRNDGHSRNQIRGTIKAISYFRDYRETSRRYTAVFWTENNKQEIEAQRELYHALFTQCWLASSSFKKIFSLPALFPQGEKPLQAMVKFATCRFVTRLNSLPDNIRPEITWPLPENQQDQLFLKEVSDVNQIEAALCWLCKVREAHIQWHAGKVTTDPDASEL